MNKYEQLLRDRRCEYEINKAFYRYNLAHELRDKDTQIAGLACEAAEIDAQSRIAYHEQMLLDAADPSVLDDAKRRVEAIRDRIRHLRADRDELCRRQSEYLKCLGEAWKSDHNDIKEQYAAHLRDLKDRRIVSCNEMTEACITAVRRMDQKHLTRCSIPVGSGRRITLTIEEDSEPEDTATRDTMVDEPVEGQQL